MIAQLQETHCLDFYQAKSLKEDLIWKNMNVPLSDLIEEWLNTLSSGTKIQYTSGINRLEHFGLIDRGISLQAFSLVNHDAIVDRIKLLPMKETTRQSRAALYIAFTGYLSRKFKGIFVKATPSKEGSKKTFFRVHDKVVTKSINQRQWLRFFEELEKINPRDSLIAKMTLQGAKRIREVLFLTTDKINWDKLEITFKQNKCRGLEKHTIITYPEAIINKLKEYVQDRKGYVFVTRSGNPVHLIQVSNTFSSAGYRARIPFKVTPQVLRVSAVTYLKNQGFSDSDIMKMTGHASGEMVRAYDKSDCAENPSKKISLVC